MGDGGASVHCRPHVSPARRSRTATCCTCCRCKELRTRYKKSVLGWAWSLLNPLTQMLIFSVIFLYVFKASPPIGDPSGLQELPAVLPVRAAAVQLLLDLRSASSIGAVQGGAGLIKKVQFPHEHLVFSVIVAQFVTLLIELVVLTVAMLIAGNMVLPWLPVLLLILVLLALFTTGVALMLAAATSSTTTSTTCGASSPSSCSTPRRSSTTRPTIELSALAARSPTTARPAASSPPIHNVMYDLRMPGLGRIAPARSCSRSASFFIGRVGVQPPVAALRRGDVTMADASRSRSSTSPRRSASTTRRRTRSSSSSPARAATATTSSPRSKDVIFDVQRGRGVRRHRAERVGQVDAAEVHGRHPPAERRQRARAQADVGAARARRRLPPRAVRARQRVPQRGDPRHGAQATSPPASTTSSSSPASSASSTRR